MENTGHLTWLMREISFDSDTLTLHTFSHHYIRSGLTHLKIIVILKHEIYRNMRENACKYTVLIS